MIFSWIDHPAFKRDEQLMSILYDLGMATTKQLLTITNWNLPFLKKVIKKIRERGQLFDEKEKWLKVLPIAGKLREKAYTLGSESIKYVQDMRSIDKKIKEFSQAQVYHYLGTTNVLCRLLEKNLDREKINWWSTNEATNTILRLVERSGEVIEKKSLIRPDARLAIDSRKYWIEFDNNTESARKLERKYHDYINTLANVKEQAPIIWVTISKKRSEYLHQNWEAVKRLFYKHSSLPLPEMHFFVQGEETNYILNHSSIQLAPSLKRK